MNFKSFHEFADERILRENKNRNKNKKINKNENMESCEVGDGQKIKLRVFNTIYPDKIIKRN